MEKTVIQAKLTNIKGIALTIFAGIMIPVNVIWFLLTYKQNVVDCADWSWSWDWVVEKYGENANVFKVTLHDYTPIFFTVLIVSVIVAGLFYLKYYRTELTVTDKRVFGKTSFGKRVDLPLDSISAVGTFGSKAIAVTTASGAIKFNQIANRDDVHKAVSDLLVARQSDKKPAAQPQPAAAAPGSTTEELKKYKELLDTGVITQEEFDAKKKQLLGL